jgi:hypothetical protein
MINLSRQFLLVWLLALSLLGVQLVQHSGLHDHSQHVVDCALCHFDSFDHQLSGIVESFLPEAGAPEQIFIPAPAYLSPQYSLYLGRSPPQVLI